MKKINSYYAFMLFMILVGCNKNNDNGTTSSLPDLTTVGKNTFGCKIGNQIFLPRDSGGLNIEDPVPILSAMYVYNEYYFGGFRLLIFADNEMLNKSIVIEMEGSQTEFLEGNTYPIVFNDIGKISATYEFVGEIVNNGDGTGFQPIYNYQTTDQQYGELKIVKLDTVNQIISGIFWFNCQEINTGEIVEIREGRFDIKYTTSF